MKISRTVATAVIAGALALAPTAASAYVPSDYSNVTASTLSPGVGSPFIITIQGPINADVTLNITSVSAAIPDSAITIAGTRSLTKTTNAEGVASFTVTLAQAGTYNAVVTDAGTGAVIRTLTLDVAAASGTSTSGGQLSSTGSDALPIALGAGALLLVGAGGVAFAKRRRQSVNA